MDVCCRDPNYKDPWPNSENFNGQQQKQQQQPQQQQQNRKKLREDPAGSAIFQDATISAVKTALPKKRRTNAYGK